MEWVRKEYDGKWIITHPVDKNLPYRGAEQGTDGAARGAWGGNKTGMFSRCLTLPQKGCSSTVRTSALALSTRKSNKAENYRADILC